MITNVYIDGFNLYYGAVKGTAYKWLDLARMCELILPRNRIQTIKYFTARVAARPSDPGKAVRQQTYLRALATTPNLTIIFGHFLSHECMMPLANPQRGQPRYASVIKVEEKGSDVNLATHLLRDGYRREYEAAAVVTNDSDLLEPIRVRQELRLPVGIINPHPRPSVVLRQQASFFKQIRTGVLSASQFPQTLADGNGTFHKPPEW